MAGFLIFVRILCLFNLSAHSARPTRWSGARVLVIMMMVVVVAVLAACVGWLVGWLVRSFVEVVRWVGGVLCIVLCVVCGV